MAGCFGSSPIDRWMEKQLFDYLDRCDRPGDFEFEFNHKLSTGGTVHVKCDAIYETWHDEDGRGSCYCAKVKYITWTFDDSDADLDDEAKSEIESHAEEEMKEQLKNF